jgi:hypothetical protein
MAADEKAALLLDRERRQFGSALLRRADGSREHDCEDDVSGHLAKT